IWQCRRELLRSWWTLFAPLCIFSALCIAGVVEPTTALFVYGWPYFFLGVVINWVHNREVPPLALAVVAAGTAALLPFAASKAAVALCTGTAIYLASVQGLLSMTLGPVLQYLGRISYSLYLVH